MGTSTCSSTFAFAVWIGILLFSSSLAQGEHSLCQNLTPSPQLTQFLDRMPIPPTINVSTGAPVTLGTYKITQKLHSQLPNTTLYAYGTSKATATYPGPTLEATRHIVSKVRFENHIPDPEPFLVVDRTLHWANPPHGGVPTVSHLHGAEAPSDSDGHPDAWFTMAGDKGPAYVTQNYTYPNTQPPTMLWYHDHTVGITRINVLSGLSGLYFIRSPSEEPPHLPSGIYEVPLVIQDKQFWANGSINFPDIGDSVANHPNWCPEYFGDTILVNGMAWPYLEVFPAKYRFRILNAANARFFNLSLSDPNLVFTQIGTDGGYLPFPLNMKTITVAPAYRVDVIVDFSGISPGSSVYLNNSAAAPFPSGDPSFSPPQTNAVMQFRVVQQVGNKSQQVAIPAFFGAEANYSLFKGYLYRNLTLVEYDDADGSPVTSTLNNRTWIDPVTELPKLGSVETWDFINLTPDAHPMHIHLINFLTVYQQPFDPDSYNNGSCSLKIPFGLAHSCFTDFPHPPNAIQVGWKDTVVVYPSFVTRITMKWSTRSGTPFSFDATTKPGYVWHCHIVDHEDNDMMRPLQPVA